MKRLRDGTQSDDVQKYRRRLKCFISSPYNQTVINTLISRLFRLSNRGNELHNQYTWLKQMQQSNNTETHAMIM